MGKVVDSFVEVTMGITKAIWGTILGPRDGWELATAWMATIGITFYSIAWAVYSFYEYWQERQRVQHILECSEWALKGYLGAIQRERRPQQISLVSAFNHVRERADQVLAILKELEAERQTKSS
jgi:hypothetical protein